MTLVIELAIYCNYFKKIVARKLNRFMGLVAVEDLARSKVIFFFKRSKVNFGL